MFPAASSPPSSAAPVGGVAAAAIAALVALATAWIEADRTPASAVLPESSASSGSAEDEARISSPEASSSITPGASGTNPADLHASAISPRRTARANKAEALASSSTSRSSNSGCPARRTRISAPQAGAVGNECAPELGAESGGCQQVAKARASLGVAARRLGHRRRLAFGAGELLELVHVFDRVLVVREDREAVGEILEAVLGDQVRPRV